MEDDLGNSKGRKFQIKQAAGSKKTVKVPRKVVSSRGVTAFQGALDPLSNFYLSPIRYAGKEFKSSEHAYQWKKAVTSGELELAEKIEKARLARDAKWLAAEVKVSEEFLENREKIMFGILEAKFRDVSDYRAALEGSGEVIVEAVRNDMFWSCGLSKDRAVRVPPERWPGENRLGRLHQQLKDRYFPGSGFSSGQKRQTESVDRVEETRPKFRAVEQDRESEEGDSEVEEPVVKDITYATLVEAQKEDLALVFLKEAVEAGEKPAYADFSGQSSEVKHYISRWDSLRLDDSEVLYLEWKDGEHSRKRYLVPYCYRKSLLEGYHDSLQGVHLGGARTLSRLQASMFYWPKMRSDVEWWTATCDVCRKTKPTLRKRRAPLGQVTAGGPFERVFLDLTGPFPETERGNRYILVVTDAFSKWVEAYAMASHPADMVASVFVQEWICRYGPAGIVHTDQGREFESTLFQEMCRVLQVDKTRTCPWRPQSDGQTERFNRSMEAMLRAVVADDQHDWDLMLPHVCAAYRATRHESTGLTPNLVVLGRETSMPLELAFGAPEGQDISAPNTSFVSDLMDRFQRAHEVVRVNMGKARERQKKQYDRRVHWTKVKVGDKVWVHNPFKPLGLSPKLQVYYDRKPYVVLQLVSEVVIKVKGGSHGRVKFIHIDNVLPVRAEQRLIDLPSAPKTFNIPSSENEIPGDPLDEADENLVQNEPNAQPTVNTPVVPTTRSGRPINRPSRYRKLWVRRGIGQVQLQ